MVTLEFKVWLERFGPTHYPTQMYPANRAGIRDVRFGYSMNTSDTPNIASRIGSDVVTGMGSVFRKSMGAAFPSFGSGYRNYFDELTSAFQDGKDFIVAKEMPYNEADDEDDPRQTILKHSTNSALQSIRINQEIEAAAAKVGIDIRNNPEIIYEPSRKGEGHVLVLFRFHPPERLSDRLKLTNAGPQEQ